MLYEGLIRGRGATISTQVGAADVMNQDCPTSPKHISPRESAFLTPRVLRRYSHWQGQPHMPVFEMTDRMLLAELARPDRIELYNIFIYQSVNVSCGGVELHRQLFHARPAQDYWAISRNNTASVPAGCRIVENRGRETAFGKFPALARKINADACEMR
jgi:hypothetical protein